MGLLKMGPKGEDFTEIGGKVGCLPIGIDCEDGIAFIHAKQAGVGVWMAMLVAMFQALEVRKESTIPIKLPKSRGNEILDILEAFLSYKKGTEI